jgi:hypothetical protein
MQIQAIVTTGNSQPWQRVYHILDDAISYNEAIRIILDRHNVKGQIVRAIEIMFPVPK